MNILSRLDHLHFQAKQNRWMRYFAVFNRIALAAGFLPAGFVKIMGERFTALSNNHPMGHYLEALSHTGYYYPFIGVLQVTAAVLLLIPRTATLGALLYFPIILNICVLSFAVRFDGSLLSSPLMVLGNLYLLCWDYDKLKFILPFKHPIIENALPKQLSNKFPIKFFGAAAATVIALVIAIGTAYQLKPYNTLSDCKKQCKNSVNPKACDCFCDSIHVAGKPLDQALDQYYETVGGTKQKQQKPEL